MFTIHIPIALSALFAPLLGIHPNNLLLLPVTVVLLELVIDPTCSIVLEREPAEEKIMERPPRKINDSLLSKSLLTKSILQGLIIFAFTFGLYYIALIEYSAPKARTMGLVALMVANIFLVQVISSNYNSFLFSLRKLAKDNVLRMIFLIMILMILLIVHSPLNHILGLESLNAFQFTLAIFCGFVSVVWYEIIKFFIRRDMKYNL